MFLFAVPPTLIVLDVIAATKEDAKTVADYAGKLLTCCTFKKPSLRLPPLRLVRGIEAKLVEFIAAASAAENLSF